MTLPDIDIEGYDTILLDRDGTINRQRVGDYVKRWGEFEFLPGVLAALARFSQTAKHIFVVTNQRGVGRGRMTREDLDAIHKRMTNEIEAHGGRVDRIYQATGIDDSDPDRKPNVGMWLRILRDYPDVRPERTLIIGDGDCDMDFARNCGVDFVRVDRQRVVFIKETTD